MNDRPFDGKVALVTGGSRGIGRAIALELARRGASVAVNYLRHEDAAAEVVKLIEAGGGRAMAIQANVGEPAEVRALAAAALDFGQGRLDFLVHSAAIGAFKPALQLRQNQFDLSMSVNARALLDLSRELLPGLRGRDARIIALTGRGSSRVLPDYAAVGASKAALEALVRYLAVALAPDGVRVNALGSGLVDTDAARAFPQAEQMKADAIARTPLGRLGTPEDIALAATLLCRAEARWITGQIIVADGGAALLV